MGSLRYRKKVRNQERKLQYKDEENFELSSAMDMAVDTLSSEIKNAPLGQNKDGIRKTVSEDVLGNVLGSNGQIEAEYKTIKSGVSEIRRKFLVSRTGCRLITLCGILFCISTMLLVSDNTWRIIKMYLEKSDLTRPILMNKEYLRCGLSLVFGMGVFMIAEGCFSTITSMASRALEMNDETQMDLLYFREYNTDISSAISLWGVSYFLIRLLGMRSEEAGIEIMKRSWKYFIVRTGIGLTIGCLLVVLKKLSIQRIAILYHRTHCKDKIQTSNMYAAIVSQIRDYVVKNAEISPILAEKFGAFSLVDEVKLSNEDLKKCMEEISQMDLIEDSNEEMYGMRELARILAYYFFKTVKGDEVVNILETNLVKADFEQILSTDMTNVAFEKLDRDKNGDISLGELADTIVDIHEERKNLMRSLVDNSDIIEKLEIVIYTILIIFFLCTLIPIFDLPQSIISSVWTALFTSSFMIMPMITSFLKSLLFILYQHPYDIGDRILVDKEQRLVKDISMFGTTFIDELGQEKYVSHESLKDAAIHNIRRARSHTQTQTIVVPTTIDLKKVAEFKSAVGKFLRNNSRDFIFKPDFFSNVITGGDKLQISINICYKSSTQDIAVFTKRQEIATIGIVKAAQETHIFDK